MRQSATFAIPGDIDTLTGGYIYEKQLLLALRRIGWDVTHLPLPAGFPEPSPQDVAATAAALAAVPADRPLILDGFLPGASPPEVLAGVRAPMISVTHHPLAYETGLAPDRAAWLKRTEQANLARMSHVIVPSRHTAQMLIDDFAVPGERITVASPGILRPARSTAPKPQPPRILSVGQLVPRKGHDILLRALATLTDLDWQAEIVGGATDPACARDLERLCDDLGLSDRVAFTGSLSPETLAARYAAATLFALATRYEGYGMVFAEALAAGLPIVTCAAGAVPDTVPEGTGLLVPPDDADAFAEALRRLLSDRESRTAFAAAADAAGHALPTWEDTARLVARQLARLA
ncbi:glycosyltransferase family 4 protein [Oceaniglobus roseus]|uniref:glycosyltransferase family 4 protein n=1 Tax=Oceaniglobus roseus TaxID=1737570 RepID=UPI000C7F6FB6|nr:glycosyltransferase family 4 protein [Kandeliimicrobium roseum]